MLRLVPSLYVDNIYELTPQTFLMKGLKGVLLDIDNTLVSYDQRHVSSRLIDWVNSLKNAGLLVAIISNGKKLRVEFYGDSLNVYSVHSALKPLRRSFLRAADRLGLACSELAIVGDQIFTDILGGNSLGMFTVLVNPVEAKEGLFFRIKRQFEKPFINRYHRQNRN